MVFPDTSSAVPQAPSPAPGLDQFHDLSGLRMSPAAPSWRIPAYRPPSPRTRRPRTRSAARRSREGLLQLSRQPGGPGLVVSTDAILDRHPHRALSARGPPRIVAVPEGDAKGIRGVVTPLLVSFPPRRIYLTHANLPPFPAPWPGRCGSLRVVCAPLLRVDGRGPGAPLPVRARRRGLYQSYGEAADLESGFGGLAASGSGFPQFLGRGRGFVGSERLNAMTGHDVEVGHAYDHRLGAVQYPFGQNWGICERAVGRPGTTLPASWRDAQTGSSAAPATSSWAGAGLRIGVTPVPCSHQGRSHPDPK